MLNKLYAFIYLKYFKIKSKFKKKKYRDFIY